MNNPNMNLIQITEGKTNLLVPETEKLLKKNPVFFNPLMELNRDISVVVAQSFARYSGTYPKKFCDALAGCGARGIRVANETDLSVTINDRNSNAYELILKNLELNNLNTDLTNADLGYVDRKYPGRRYPDVEMKYPDVKLTGAGNSIKDTDSPKDANVAVTNIDANTLLSSEKFDFIDIDPFGSPVRFLDSALRSIENYGILAVTATDTGALCGTYPAACRRKYDAVPIRSDYYNELGLRILIGYIARVAARYEKGIKPLFSHCTRHYFRTYIEIKRGRKHAAKSLENINFIRHCFTCLGRTVLPLSKLDSKYCSCKTGTVTGGPLWSDDFTDPDSCDHIIEMLQSGVFGSGGTAIKLIEQVKSEHDINTPYYNIHKICKKLKIPARPMDEIISSLEKGGFKAARTHFSGLGLRSDATVSDISQSLEN